MSRDRRPSAGRLLRTVRHLRPSQLPGFAFHRIWGHLGPRLGPALGSRLTRHDDAANSPDEKVLDAWRHALLRLLPLGDAPLARSRAFAAGDVVALGQRHRFTEGIDWSHAKAGRLWAYHLHYLDALPALAASAARGEEADAQRLEELLESWIRGNPPGRDPGWRPYPLSLRIVHMLRAGVLLHESHGGLRQRLLREAARQATWLAWIPETHLGANHLLANLKALLLATAALPDHGGLRSRRSRHLRMLQRELDEQFLADGGHYERTPMYHAALTGDLHELRDALAVWGEFPASLQASLTDHAERAARWLAAMRHPDGGLSFFNDTNLEEVYLPSALAPRTGSPERAGCPHLALLESGYHVVRTDPWHLLWDCGPIGPRHQPGHAHADILSVELSLGEHRLFVNGGLRGYADDPRRDHVRSTAAHNTVQIGDGDQIELWASFRVGVRGEPVLEEARLEGGRLELRGHYDWPTLPGRARHRRTLRMTPEAELTIEDEIMGSGDRCITARYLLHPEVEVHPMDGAHELRGPGGTCRLVIAAEQCRIEDAQWHPRFGQDEPTRQIVLERQGDGLLVVTLTPNPP